MAKALAGYVQTLFGKDTATNEAGTVEIKSGGKTLATYSGIEHPFPVKRAALESAFADLEHEVVDVDGVSHVLKGIDAAAGKYFQHACESIRGGIRTDLLKGRTLTNELVQARYNSATSFGGRSSSGRSRVLATEDQLAGMSKAEVIAYLKSQGAIA